jgi:exonuclease III
MRLVSWNCRGLGNPMKADAVKDLLKIEPSDILMIQETKIEGKALLDISKKKWKKNAGIAVSSRGSSGGLATLWTEELLQLTKSHETPHWIFTELTHCTSKLTISLFNLYVPVLYSEKRVCWNTLNEFLEQHTPSNIILAGDLNIVLKPKEKRGGIDSRDTMLPMVETLIQQWDLLDFSPSNGLYTWSNNRVGAEHISARLDRFLVQSTLMMSKKIISTKILPKLTSDHKPIQLILEDEEDLGPIPFRFSPLWVEKDGFIDTVKAAWGKSFSGSSSYVWEQKLKATKQALKRWIKNPDPNPTSQRKEIVQSLDALQTEMEIREVTPLLLNEEVKTQCSSFRAFRMEEEYWRIKSRSLWLKAGDRNTSFFHRQYRARLSKNHISEITTAEGQICKGFSQLKEAAVTHFKHLYTADSQNSEEDTADFLANIPLLISPEDNVILTKPITEEEIIKVIWSMESNKAPGPDGFSILFYKTCWDIIKADLLKMAQGFMKKAKIGGGTNSTYLALIPKETNPETFARFRPISLCNASYKILAKLLATRIKPLLNRLISSNQGGFVEGRHILDNVIQVQEIIHSSKQRNEKGMLIKLDMANAFDRVNRAFLCKVLHSYGFSSHFVNLITACTDNPWIAPLVNGRPSSFFQAQRGLRQGCPLSPFLYILMADSLSRKLTAAQATGSLPGLKPSTSSPSQNHALFADDSLLLGGASVQIAREFDSVLKRYCRVSGALINERKSAIYGWNIGQRELAGISNILGFTGHAHWEKINYLGLPITNSCNKRSLWSDIISKIKTKISAWGGYWLTKGGKVVLIKAVLAALPIYQAAFILAPKSVTDQISKLLRDFLWQGGKRNQHKYHLVRWETVKRSISEGGLQIRDPAMVNQAFGGKIAWNLFTNPKHPVSEILKEKYAPHVQLRDLQVSHNRHSTQVWRLCNKSLNFFKGKAYRIPGNGKHVNLWQDRIMDRDPLEDNEEITDLKEWLERAGINSVYDLSKWDSHDDWKGWDFFGVPDRLKQQQCILEELLEEAAPVNRKTKDSWGWGRSGIYTVSEAYNALQPDRNCSKSPDFWRKVWDPLALPKVNFFFWTLVHNKLLTGDNLEKRSIAGPHRCELCRSSTETAKHLFMDCKFATEVWSLLLQDLKISVPQFHL